MVRVCVFGVGVCQMIVPWASGMCVWGVCVVLQINAHLANGTGRRTATMTVPLLFTSGLMK